MKGKRKHTKQSDGQAVVLHFLKEEVKHMRITLHIGGFTVTIIVKSNNRHSAK